MLWAMNGLGLLAVGFIVSGVVLGILSRPLVILWYWLQEIQDETTGMDIDPVSDHSDER